MFLQVLRQKSTSVKKNYLVRRNDMRKSMLAAASQDL